MAGGTSDRFQWLPGAGVLASLLACYGTLAAVAVLSMVGVPLAIPEGVWAGAIVLFALLAVLGVSLGYRRHGTAGPVILAVIGAAAIVWVMFGAFDRALEIGAFAVLAVAALWDWRIRARPTHGPPSADRQRGSDHGLRG